MTIYLATAVYGSLIPAGAYISAHHDMASALAAALADYDGSEWDVSKAELVPGRFGDCWHKFYRAPTDDDTFSPFARDQISVRGPGEHPGTRAWWIEPTEPVYVLAGIREREEPTP